MLAAAHRSGSIELLATPTLGTQANFTIVAGDNQLNFAMLIGTLNNHLALILRDNKTSVAGGTSNRVKMNAYSLLPEELHLKALNRNIWTGIDFAGIGGKGLSGDKCSDNTNDICKKTHVNLP